MYKNGLHNNSHSPKKKKNQPKKINKYNIIKITFRLSVLLSHIFISARQNVQKKKIINTDSSRGRSFTFYFS